MSKVLYMPDRCQVRSLTERKGVGLEQERGGENESPACAPAGVGEGLRNRVSGRQSLMAEAFEQVVRTKCLAQVPGEGDPTGGQATPGKTGHTRDLGSKFNGTWWGQSDMLKMYL